MKRRGTCRTQLVCATIGFSLSAWMQQAIAGQALSPWGYYGPVSGYNYQNRAEIDTNNTSAWGYTEVETQKGANVPTGYMGTLARLYKGGSLCSQAGYSYNDIRTSYWENEDLNDCGSGNYYSYGATRAYNGNGYNSYYTFQSPVQGY